MKEILKIIFALVGILAGVIAIIKIVGTPSLTIAFMSLTFGIMAIIWTSMAHNSLSPGSSLRSYTGYFLVCLILVMLFSIWDGVVKVFNLTGNWLYTEYVFLTLAYIVFATAANKIYHLGKEFGFQKEAAKIKDVMKETRKK